VTLPRHPHPLRFHSVSSTRSTLHFPRSFSAKPIPDEGERLQPVFDGLCFGVARII
jgi:hypothetical protein